MRFAAARSWVARQVDSGALPAAVLGVASRDEVLLVQGFGSVDGAPVPVEQRFALFSVSKVVAGLTAARALERGLLSWQTPLAEVVGEVTAGAATLVQLLSHTSGLTDAALDDRRPAHEQLVAAGRAFEPGTASQYNNLAFRGAAALVERASGRSWPELVSETAEAAGAPGLDFDPDASPAVQGAEESGLDTVAIARTTHPGAGMHGSVPDLLALGQTLLRGGEPVVHPSTDAAMRRPLTVGLPRLEPYPASRGQDWGLTWNLRHHAPGLIERDTHGHAGASGTEFWLLPRQGLCWALLTHRMAPPVDVDQLHNAIATGR